MTRAQGLAAYHDIDPLTGMANRRLWRKVLLVTPGGGSHGHRMIDPSLRLITIPDWPLA